MSILDTNETIEPARDEAYFKGLADHCHGYRGSYTGRSLLQLSLSLVLFIASVAALIWSVQNAYWTAYALLLIPTGGFLVRLFIIQHDCGHGSFFKKRKHNDLLGSLIGVLTWTPYSFWRRTHNMHHASSGNLDRRGYGRR